MIQIIFTILLVLWVFVLIWSFSVAPYVPTKSTDIDRIDRILALQSWNKFLEIWPGDGRVIFTLATRHPNTHFTGIELSPLLYMFLKIRVWTYSLKNVTILFADALRHDISKYDAIYVFWTDTTVNTLIAPKINAELKGTGKFLSYGFPIDSWEGQYTRIKEKTTVLALHLYQR